MTLKEVTYVKEISILHKINHFQTLGHLSRSKKHLRFRLGSSKLIGPDLGKTYFNIICKKVTSCLCCLWHSFRCINKYVCWNSIRQIVVEQITKMNAKGILWQILTNNSFLSRMRCEFTILLDNISFILRGNSDGTGAYF
jgi:hypothetical protein